MKKLSLLCAFFLLVTLVNAQNELPINEQTGKATFLEVVDAEGLSAKKLYELTKKWAESKGYVVQEDVPGDQVVYKASTKVYYPSPNGGGTTDEGLVHFSFSGFFKDGKYRLIVTDFTHEGEGKLPDGGKLENQTPECGKIKMSGRGWVTIKNKTRENVEELIADVKRVIKEVENDPANNDNW